METTNKTVVTQEMIAAWKQQYGDVYEIEVEGRKAYLKAPDRKTMGYAATLGAKDPVRFNEVILKNCWLGGDEAIRENDRLFLGAGQVLGKIIEVADAAIKKL